MRMEKWVKGEKGEREVHVRQAVIDYFSVYGATLVETTGCLEERKCFRVRLPLLIWLHSRLFRAEHRMSFPCTTSNRIKSL